MTLYGSMQEFPLTTGHILDRMGRIYADSEVVTLREPDRTTRASFSAVVERAERLSAALAELGVGDGDRVATYAWNTQEHLEAYLAVPTMGAVLHTLNIRLFAEQLVYVANHAEDKVVLVDASLVGPLAKLAGQLETVEHFVVMGQGAEGELPGQLDYEELLAAQSPGYDYPVLEERQAAALCYTSGTTGNPKGVLYSHRSTVMHAMGAGMAESIGMTSADRVLPVVPMFHANAWGLAHTAGLVGADLIMPSRFLQAEPLAELIEGEQVTLAGGVPTVFMDVLRHADEHKVDFSSLRKVTCGGSAVPLSLMQAFEERHGVYIEQAWGMTEMSPLGTIARPPADAEATGVGHRASAGRISLVEVVGQGAEAELPNQLDYEELLAAQSPGFDYPELEENQAAALCYTSGTTGNPKGVLYSHRSTVLHAMGAGHGRVDRRQLGRPDAADRAHVPRQRLGPGAQAGLVGADLIMPSRFLQAEPLCDLIEQEKVTHRRRRAHGVHGRAAPRGRERRGLLDAAQGHVRRLGRAAVADAGLRGAPRRVHRAGVGDDRDEPAGHHRAPARRTPRSDQVWDYRASAGRINPLVEARIVADDGSEADWDGQATGELEVRGPWIAAAYYRDDGDDKFDDGWLRTGDIASIDPRGYVRITDRAKDVIKSGGEWISSVELENEIMGHPDVAEAAVIAIPDERWSERPLACIVPEEGKDVSAASVRDHLGDRVAKWWLPDTYAVIDEVPKTSVGKFDKKVLRQRLEDGELETEQVEEVKT